MKYRIVSATVFQNKYVIITYIIIVYKIINSEDIYFCSQVKYAPKVKIQIKSGINGKIPEGQDVVIGKLLH